VVAAGFADNYDEPLLRHVVFVLRYDLDASPCAPASGRLLLRRLDGAPGDERMDVGTTFAIAARGAFDPVSSGIGLALAGSDATPFFQIDVPPGAFDPVTGVGWRIRQAGRLWAFVDATRSTGIRSLLVRRLDAERVRVKARVERTIDLPPGAPPLRVEIHYADACAALQLPAVRCTGMSRGRLLCR
jgi:hypothetical protein